MYKSEKMFREFQDILGGAECLAKFSSELDDFRYEFSLPEHEQWSSTFSSFRKIKELDSSWIEDFKREINVDHDPTRLNSRLAELRAYGDLLEIFSKRITPTKRKNGGAGNYDLKVEVYNQTYKPNCKRKESSGRDTCSGCNCEESIVSPFVNFQSALARLKEGATTASETVRNIASGKKDEHQADVDIPTWLYLDFQSVWTNDCYVFQTQPIFSTEECLSTGMFWLAFYGEAGIPILSYADLHLPEVHPKMREPGIFNKVMASKFAGAVLRFSKGKNASCNPLVFFENPRKRATPLIVKKMLMNSALMNHEFSVIAGPGWDISKYVDECNRRILSEVMARKS